MVLMEEGAKQKLASKGWNIPETVRTSGYVFWELAK